MFGDFKNKAASRATFSLGIPEGYELPSEDTLKASLREIVRTNLLLDRELAPKGLMVSPVWESHGGNAAVRAVVAPKQFRDRYYAGKGAAALLDRGMASAIIGVLRWLSDTPEDAALALADTFAFWISADAPIRSLERTYEPHMMLLSLLCADLARKNAAGMTVMELLASLGIPLDTHDPAVDPPIPRIKESMRAKFEAMHEEEAAWVRRWLRGREEQGHFP